MILWKPCYFSDVFLLLWYDIAFVYQIEEIFIVPSFIVFRLEPSCLETLEGKTFCSLWPNQFDAQRFYPSLFTSFKFHSTDLPFSEMETDERQSATTNSSKQPSAKLKFGIERLLSEEPKLAKPVPTVAVPCSDCVTSLFRCCRLSPPEHGYMGQNHQHHHGFGTAGSGAHHQGGIYTVQPIRPFATRPGEN